MTFATAPPTWLQWDGLLSASALNGFAKYVFPGAGDLHTGNWADGITGEEQHTESKQSFQTNANAFRIWEKLMPASLSPLLPWGQQWSLSFI